MSKTNLKKFPEDWDKHILFACHSYFDKRDNDKLTVSFDAGSLMQNGELLTTVSYKDITYFASSKIIGNKISSKINKVIQISKLSFEEPKGATPFPDGKFKQVSYVQISAWDGTSVSDFVKYLEKTIIKDSNNGGDESPEPDSPMCPYDEEIEKSSVFSRKVKTELVLY